MAQPDELIYPAFGAIAGGALYILCAKLKGVSPDLLLVEAMLSGAGSVGGAYLAYLVVFAPLELLHCSLSQEELKQKGISFSMSSLHRLEIFVGSLILVFMATRSVYSLCKKPGHP